MLLYLRGHFASRPFKIFSGGGWIQIPHFSFFSESSEGMSLSAVVCLTMSGLEPKSAWPGAQNQIEAVFQQ